MANPAPIIINLPAFDVGVGTTIDFNIIGGTNIVRSNKLYVYNMDNELIFTHLYTSTYSIHELPDRQDATIEYASGKTYTDFANENQYYAIIQTFTNTSGTDGASGYSTAKIFWALPTPTLEFDTISASIATTSYNAQVTYNTNIVSDITATNIVQQYQFDLYNASGALISSTGLVTGSGEQSGTSTEYTLSNNFTGMQNGVSYYIEVSVITSNGMSLSEESTTFIVQIDAPSLGQAVAINNSCNGYISIVSTLSGDYDSSINKVLVKRLDNADVTGTWLTLFSIDVDSASDMDFTVIDFYNCYGKDYRYAIVPIMIQNQGTESEPIYVEVEGSYTLSNIVESVFDGVFIADNTAIQRLQANVGYSNMNRRQSIGSIETIGSKYPTIVFNNNLDYHTGTISATALHEGFYSTSAYTVLDTLVTNGGNPIVTSGDEILFALTEIPANTYRYYRPALVAIRKTIEDFLTNKSPKILKDWNGNIWLVVFTSDISLEFTNEWGMGIASFSASWTEIGDAEDQSDLQDSGLINIGGV